MLRGPSSTLYGANALGGVIDLRQQSPLTARVGSTLVAEGGSFGRGTLNYALLANNAGSGKAATQGTALSLTATHDDGFRPNADREAVSAFLKHEQRLSPNLVFDVVGSADHGKAGLPGQQLGGPPNVTDWQRDGGWLLSPGLRFQDEDTEASVFWSRAGSSIQSLTVPFANRYLLDRDELTATSGGVQSLGDAFLARAGFAEDEHAGVGGSQPVNGESQRGHRGGSADQLRGIDLGALSAVELPPECLRPGGGTQGLLPAFGRIAEIEHVKGTVPAGLHGCRRIEPGTDHDEITIGGRQAGPQSRPLPGSEQGRADKIHLVE